MTIAPAAIVAFTCVASISVVVCGTLLKLRTELPLKFVPLTVKSKAGSPTVLSVGKMLANVGAGLFTVKLSGPVVPPPGVGLVTVT